MPLKNCDEKFHKLLTHEMMMSFKAIWKFSLTVLLVFNEISNVLWQAFRQTFLASVSAIFSKFLRVIKLLH